MSHKHIQLSIAVERDRVFTDPLSVPLESVSLSFSLQSLRICLRSSVPYNIRLHVNLLEKVTELIDVILKGVCVCMKESNKREGLQVGTRLYLIKANIFIRFISVSISRRDNSIEYRVQTKKNSSTLSIVSSLSRETSKTNRNQFSMVTRTFQNRVISSLISTKIPTIKS